MPARAERIEAETGPVPVLTNSAGVLRPPLRPSARPTVSWDEVVRADRRGAWLGRAPFGRRVAGRRRGGTVDVASTVGPRAASLHAHGPAKAAVAAMTGNLAAEWGPEGVRVDAVSPGFVEAPAPRAEAEAGRRDPPPISGAEAPGRTVRVEEVAQAVLSPSGERAPAITGVNPPVDRGWPAATGRAARGGLRGPEGADA